ncbi:MAG: hypothetical protein ACKOWE_00645 [Micrococcales bacterium]
MNTAILNSVELLIFVSQPALGKWQDASSLAYGQKLDHILQNLRNLKLQAKALDLLLAVPGV